MPGAVRRSNLAIERHASNIYTRAVFEEFRRLLIEGTAYNVTEVEWMRRYVTTHDNAAKIKSRVVYELTVSDDQTEYTCECGQFEHTGMLCSHILRVIFLEMEACPRPLHHDDEGHGDSGKTHSETVDQGRDGQTYGPPCSVPKGQFDQLVVQVQAFEVVLQSYECGLYG